MSDYSAIDLSEATLPASVPAGLARRARAFVGGALLAVALVAVGAVLAILALTAGVVGAPLVVPAIAILVARRRRGGRAPALVPTPA